jgi:hypothetical protein
MISNRIGFACVAAAMCVGSACTDLESATNLNPEGPPMIRQVRLTEATREASGTLLPRRVFAFGTHPQYTLNNVKPTSSALAFQPTLRVIMDELLVGNHLEEIACRAPVDDDAYDTVPVGATPEDIAKCAVSQDVLPASCKGSKAVCLCKRDAGCGDIPKGAPVGVLDVNQDGAADDTRFIQGAVQFRCTTASNQLLSVPLDVNLSYWNPSGDQNVPARGGFEALGPAVVLVPGAAPNSPAGTPSSLPTNTTCNLAFAPSVVDKSGLQVCAPPDGDVDQPCTPGDTSAFSFKVEAFEFYDPFGGPGTNVSRTAPFNVNANAPISPASLGGIMVTPNVPFTATVPLPRVVRITWDAPGLAPETEYTVTLPTTLTDVYGQGLPTAQTITFTTGL